MMCPYCREKETRVIDKRDSDESFVSRRRRECVSCKKRFTTYERVEELKIKIIKKDGSIQDYDREKLHRGIEISSEKRIPENELDKLVDEIELKILNRKSNVVPASDIGRMVLTRLKHLDKVAYLRFASVFLDFEGLDEFKEELKKIE
ncbi:transcriptional regulator NrdR [candidate division WWE3 bacterium CG_4_9_14_0_2_um_filter_35_11]|uniref:Transcriptional repressor NrdR n=1 Tax=candidate division WWE3 bacterium CG_4_9_14_0_2_um_filter_35_11 TaxID=1975077 RepID=A0A2M8ELC9_UNCKA|nr:MAG: transcriptional regulator NrdR [candidate division WWE3 bacterium CG10_big_fil_rev_8_21_14_0_10_35_32]PJC23525.1 MAG: transcriptional regulator NrdR [candidate division WWE3 bacterium CG_4_9_14_0_2_um_filter_35_11]